VRGANTFLKRKYNSRIWNILHDRFPSVFPMFPQINVGGNSAHFTPLEDAPMSLASLARKRVGCDRIIHPFLKKMIENHVNVVPNAWLTSKMMVLQASQSHNYICHAYHEYALVIHLYDRLLKYSQSKFLFLGLWG